jgi:hypothetical protein
MGNEESDQVMTAERPARKEKEAGEAADGKG